MTAHISRGLPADKYHALKALSASGIWSLADINEGCPLKFWLSSPWNPDLEPVNSAQFDIGRAAHLAALEPHLFEGQTVIVPAEVLDKLGGYGTLAAKEIRDAAYAAGKTPLKPGEHATVSAMRRAIEGDPLARAAFTGDGESEVTISWIDPNYGIACKARADRVLEGGRILVDLKSATSAHPIGFGRAIWEHGYFSRAAWYLDAPWNEAGFEQPTEYWFVVVEKKPPYLTAVHKLPEKAIEWGRIINRTAVNLFVECMARGEWPGYRPIGANGPRAFVTGLPGFAEYQLHNWSEDGAFKPRSISAADVKRAAKLFAPEMGREFVP